MKLPNAYSKGKLPDNDATLAKYGETAPTRKDPADPNQTMPGVMDTLDALDLAFESDNPWQEIRTAIRHGEPVFPKGKKALGEAGRKVLRQLRIRRALRGLLIAIAERDEVFFADMAKHFATNGGKDHNSANAVRQFTADAKFMSDFLGKDSLTFRQIADATGVDPKTARDAAADMDYKAKPKGRGGKKSIGV